MVNIPISIQIKPYTGSKEKLKQKYYEKLRIAKMIEDYINTKMKDTDIHMFTYGSIAIDLGLSSEVVRDLLFTVDCGHTGITVCNPEIRTSNF